MYKTDTKYEAKRLRETTFTIANWRKNIMLGHQK